MDPKKFDRTMLVCGTVIVVAVIAAFTLRPELLSDPRVASILTGLGTYAFGKAQHNSQAKAVARASIAPKG